MTDRVMAIVALALLGVFLWILVANVPRFDLGAVVVVTYLLVIYDFLISPSRHGR